MRSYFALQENQLHQGGWITVNAWARHKIQLNTAPIKIFTARGGEKEAQVVAEVTSEGIRAIHDGRILSLKDLHG